ncbi:MAG: hypothetical protein IPK71_08690 [Myxococcales bacterium]|nr:hypothetical protein [Myxococcales bacterium]
MRASARKYAIFAPLLLAAGAGLVALVACENQSGTYVYRGRKYDPGTKCLEAPRALDVIEVEQLPALCVDTCLTQKDYDGGLAVYVSQTCPPYPPGFDVSGKEPLCVPALEAAKNASGCIPPPPDGGPDASGDADTPDASTPDASTPDASDASIPDAGDASTLDAGDASADVGPG